MTLDINRLREETPGCRHRVHLNNAGAALMPRCVVEEQIHHLQLEAEIGGYEADRVKQYEHNAVYQAIAQLLDTTPRHIALQDNATRGWHLAFFSIPWAAGDRILTTRTEYASNHISFLQVAQTHGVHIDIAPTTAEGTADVAALAQMLTPQTRLVAITHMPTGSGIVNPVAEVGRVVEHHSAFYLVDACQSVGHCPVSVREIQCDFLAATGRKYLRGPRGTGFLYTSDRAMRELTPPFLDLHAATWDRSTGYTVSPAATRYETWETNRSGLLGLGQAVRYLLDLQVQHTWERIQTLSKSLRSILASVPGIVVTDPPGARSGIVSFTVTDHDQKGIAQQLQARCINVTTSSVNAARLDMLDRHQSLVLRASLHYYNTEQEIDAFVETLRELCHG